MEKDGKGYQHVPHTYDTFWGQTYTSGSDASHRTPGPYWRATVGSGSVSLPIQTNWKEQVNHFMHTSNGVPWQVYDAVEVFAGVGMLSRCLQLANFETASLDIKHWDPFTERRLCKRLRKPTCSGNPLDLLSPAGMAFLDSYITHERCGTHSVMYIILYIDFQHWI